MEAVVEAAVDYSLSHEEPQITLDDLEKAFISGAKWIVEDKTEKKKRKKKKRKQ